MLDAKVRAKAVLAIERLIEIAGFAEIISHAPGEITLRIKPRGLLIVMGTNLAEFEELKDYARGIFNVDANKGQRTVTIKYDDKVIPKELWELLIRGNSVPRIQKVVRKEIFNRVLADIEPTKTGTDSR